MEHDKALGGKRILILRASGSGSYYVNALQARGASANSTSVLRIEPIADNTALDEALTRIGSYDWVVFTSANTVRVVERRLAQLTIDPGRTHPRQVAVVGPATLRAVQRIGWTVELVPARNSAAGLLEALVTVSRKETSGLPTVLLPQSDRADNMLETELARAGYDVNRIVVYRTVIDDEAAQSAAQVIEAEEVDVLVFTSPSTVYAMAAGLAGGHASPSIICIGERTACACVEAELTVAAVCG
ncbi:MAG TPA: uroporphyrinogen-III synthase, partial [Chloroflexota bacterium]|nr:uroporphyrinogen-III synthase [Chloroflexota bacterium]